MPPLIIAVAAVAAGYGAAAGAVALGLVAAGELGAFAIAGVASIATPYRGETRLAGADARQPL